MNILEKHPLPWRVAVNGESIYKEYPGIYTDKPDIRRSQAEDDCIVDANNVEVIGTSEWLRGTEALPFIVECVNARSVLEKIMLAHRFNIASMPAHEVHSLCYEATLGVVRR